MSNALAWDFDISRWPCASGGVIGASGEAVEASLSKIDTRRPGASSARSNAMAKEGHVNYDISDVPIEARGAPTMGSGWYG
jgi:hypothetical protein